MANALQALAGKGDATSFNRAHMDDLILKGHTDASDLHRRSEALVATQAFHEFDMEDREKERTAARLQNLTTPITPEQIPGWGFRGDSILYSAGPQQDERKSPQEMGHEHEELQHQFYAQGQKLPDNTKAP